MFSKQQRKLRGSENCWSVLVVPKCKAVIKFGCSVKKWEKFRQ